MFYQPAASRQYTPYAPRQCRDQALRGNRKSRRSSGGSNAYILRNSSSIRSWKVFSLSITQFGSCCGSIFQMSCSFCMRNRSLFPLSSLTSTVKRPSLGPPNFLKLNSFNRPFTFTNLVKCIFFFTSIRIVQKM